MCIQGRIDSLTAALARSEEEKKLVITSSKSYHDRVGVLSQANSELEQKIAVHETELFRYRELMGDEGLQTTVAQLRDQVKGHEARVKSHDQAMADQKLLYTDRIHETQKVCIHTYIYNPIYITLYLYT